MKYTTKTPKKENEEGTREITYTGGQTKKEY